MLRKHLINMDHDLLNILRLVVHLCLNVYIIDKTWILLRIMVNSCSFLWTKCFLYHVIVLEPNALEQNYSYWISANCSFWYFYFEPSHQSATYYWYRFPVDINESRSCRRDIGDHNNISIKFNQDIDIEFLQIARFGTFISIHAINQLLSDTDFR